MRQWRKLVWKCGRLNEMRHCFSPPLSVETMKNFLPFSGKFRKFQRMKLKMIEILIDHFLKLFEIVVNWSDRCCCLRDKSLLISTATAFCLNFNDDMQKIILWEKGIKSNSKDEMKGGEMRDEKGRVQITNCPRGS